MTFVEQKLKEMRLRRLWGLVRHGIAFVTGFAVGWWLHG